MNPDDGAQAGTESPEEVAPWETLVEPVKSRMVHDSINEEKADPYTPSLWDRFVTMLEKKGFVELRAIVDHLWSRQVETMKGIEFVNQVAEAIPDDETDRQRAIDETTKRDWQLVMVLAQRRRIIRKILDLYSLRAELPYWDQLDVDTRGEVLGDLAEPIQWKTAENILVGLFKELIKANLVEIVGNLNAAIKGHFMYRGNPNRRGLRPALIRWQSANDQLVYLVELLIDAGYFGADRKWKQIEDHFCKKDNSRFSSGSLSTTRGKMKENKPRQRAEEIESIVEEVKTMPFQID